MAAPTSRSSPLRAAATPAFYVPVGSPDDVEEVDSLPESGATSSTGEDLDDSDAEQQWRDSLEQIELILTLVLIPYVGKYFGRKFAYWGWAKFMEWKYPVQVVITNPTAFKGAGAIEAASSL